MTQTEHVCHLVELSYALQYWIDVWSNDPPGAIEAIGALESIDADLTEILGAYPRDGF